MIVRERGRLEWPRELALRLGGQVFVLALALVLVHAGALWVGVVGCVCGLLSIGDR